MRLSNGFVIDKEKTFGELKFTAVRDVFLQNEDGTPSTQLKKRIYDLKCSLHGGFGVRIEDMVWLAPDGTKDLTNSPKELIIL